MTKGGCLLPILKFVFDLKLCRKKCRAIITHTSLPNYAYKLLCYCAFLPLQLERFLQNYLICAQKVHEMKCISLIWNGRCVIYSLQIWGRTEYKTKPNQYVSRLARRDRADLGTYQSYSFTLNLSYSRCLLLFWGLSALSVIPGKLA